jgi:hypothetical protein
VQGGKPFRGGLSPEIWIVIGLCALAFLLNRHIVRPWVIESVVNGPLTVVVNSLPNLVEAMLGTIIIAGILLDIWRRVAGPRIYSDCTTIYAVATVIAGLFVISSEVNWIRFRGPNVYDPKDLAASVLGLFLIYFLLARFGLFYEREAESEREDE